MNFRQLSLALAATFLLVPHAVTEEAKVKERVLFQGKWENWKSHDSGGSGEVTVEDGSMILGTGLMLTGAIYQDTKDLPATNYEISLEMMRVDGNDFACGLTFPVGDWETCATLILGGWGGGLVGISSLDNMDASENATQSIFPFKDKQWYAIRLRITPARIQAWIDDKQVIDQDIKGVKVGLRPGPMSEYTPLSVTSFQTKSAIRNILWKAVDGPAPSEKKSLD